MKKIVLSICILLVSSVTFHLNAANNFNGKALNIIAHADNAPVVKSYLALKDALAADDPAAAKQAAEALKGAASNMKGESKNLKALQKESKAMAGAADLKSQRALMSSLSTSLWALLKEEGSTETLYLAYCPMAKASWLSNEKAITNPYYGKSMFSCGTVKETLEAKQ